MPQQEPDIIINGRNLTEGQALTLRVALQDFILQISPEDSLGNDDHGKLLRIKYLDRAGEINEFMQKVAHAPATPATPELYKQAEEFWAGVVDPPLMKVIRKLSFEDCRIVDKYVSGAMTDFALTHRVAEAAPTTPDEEARDGDDAQMDSSRGSTRRKIYWHSRGRNKGRS